jgi:UDP-glucuronate 4-epimerase
MAILVTGGAGFIGSHLVERLLASGRHPVICLDNFNDYYDPAIKRANVAAFAADPRVKLVEADLCDADAMRRLFADAGVTHVVHLGAYAGVLPSVEKPLLYQRNNVGGTLSLLEAARQHAVERFLLVSSSTVYGNGAASPFVEDAPLGIPTSPYGATKRAAELLGLTYWELHRVPVVCLRPFSVYGPRLRPDLAVAIFARQIAAGKPVPLFGDGSIRRDFTYVDDINSGLATALGADGVVGQCINLGHSEPIAIRDVIDSISRAIGRKATIDRQPEKPADMRITYADLTKARRLLNYQPQVSFEEGIRRYIEWLRSTGQLVAT